jgi:hypothetical protein
MRTDSTARRAAPAGLAALLATALWLPASAPAAAAPTDACALFTTEQVSTVLGISVADGEHIVPNSRTSCGWMGPGGMSIGAKKMVLSLMSERSFEAGKTPVKGVTKITAAGIGDEAYYISMPPFGTALSVRKGDTCFQLRIAGYPTGEVRNLERQLALRLVARV